MRLLGMRALTGLLNGRPPGPESSVSKLYWSEYHQRVTELAMRILGADALTPAGRWPTNMVRTDDPGAPRRLRVLGGHVPQRAWRERSTRARHRCSATSSVNRCSACRGT